MKCPRCKTELSPGDVQGVAVSRCPSCDGIWLDEDGFREAKDNAEPNAAWMDVELWEDPSRFEVAAHGLFCPSCAKRLLTLRYGETKVEIDYCRRCRGIWLDAKEFEHIVAALEDQLARMPASELLGEALREAGQIIKEPESAFMELPAVARVLELLKLRVLIEHPVLTRLFLGLEKGTPFS